MDKVVFHRILNQLGSDEGHQGFFRLRGLKAALLAITASLRKRSAVKRHGVTQGFLALQT